MMKISDMTLEGLMPSDIDRIRNSLNADAEAQYRRLTQTIILIEKFKPQILALRRSGFPWTVIAKKLEVLTKMSISASSIRNYFERHPRPSNKKTLTFKARNQNEMDARVSNASAHNSSKQSGSS